jgi:hypothetical protein
MLVEKLINFQYSILTNNIFPNIPSDFLFSFRKNSEKNISENNIICVGTGQVTMVAASNTFWVSYWT